MGNGTTRAGDEQPVVARASIDTGEGRRVVVITVTQLNLADDVSRLQ